MNSLILIDTFFGANERGIILFGFEIYYYAIVIVTGMLIASALSALLMKRRNISPDFIFVLFLFCIPSAIICARLFYCITDAHTTILDFFKFRDGGLSIIGGVLGGVGMGYIVCKVKKVNFLRAADCVVVNILLAQAIGRWGNFFNAEVYGAEVANESMQWFPFAVPISPDHNTYGIGSFSDPASTWHYAFFFYEMMINLVGWALLFTFTWYRKRKPNGLSTCLYFVWYGLVRTVMEPLRDPKYILQGGDVPWSLVFSVLMAGLGTIATLVLLILNFKKEGAFIGSRTGNPYGIDVYLTPYKNDPPYFSKINLFGSQYPPKPTEPKGDIKNENKDGTEKDDDHKKE